MEIFRRKGDKMLADQRGDASIEAIDELSFTQCCVPFQRLGEFTHLQKLTMISMTPQLKDLATFPLYPTAFTKTLRRLNLSDNKIASIDASVFNLPCLEQLILSNNLLSTVESFADAIVGKGMGANGGAPKLQWLDIDSNPIEGELKAKEKGMGSEAAGGDDGVESSSAAVGYYYRNVVFGVIPSLVVLDGFDKDGGEVEELDSEDDDDDDDEDDYDEEDDEEEEEEGEVASGDDDDADQPSRKALRSE